ncbi:MAG: HipA N-terminal domain-containing protein [Desulfobacterales bacterium]|nr:HipA N-terminal domain-containing protein [Desulfobacterales bacterium]
MAKKKNKARVYLGDRMAGLLEKTDSGYRFAYDKDYLSAGEAQPVSLTLPLSERPYESRTLFLFFLGLIPEGWFLDLTSRVLKIDPENAFDVLLATGADCIGAVRVLPLEEDDES